MEIIKASTPSADGFRMPPGVEAPVYASYDTCVVFYKGGRVVPGPGVIAGHLHHPDMGGEQGSGIVVLGPAGAAHQGCILIFPERADSWQYGGYAARRAFAEVAEAIAILLL